MSASRFTVLGSGASSAVPWLACVLEQGPGCCAVCADALARPLGPNCRRNVSAGLSFARPDGGGDFHVVVDCGKTFRDTVARVWPRLTPPLRRIDALLLTHPHADAFMGLDCLREVAPSAPVHVYCHAPTMERIRATFPYLVPRSSDGGAAPLSPAAPVTYIAQLVFHVITPWEPFVLDGSGGLVVTPIPVEHAGPCGAPHVDEAEETLAFEFGAVLLEGGVDACGASLQVGRGAGESSTVAGALRSAITPGEAAALSDSTLLPRDGRGLPSLPAWHGDRLLWVSDIRALSAEVRAYFAARPTTLLCIDALGHREYPTHFSIAQALACAVDVMGPGSATAVAQVDGIGGVTVGFESCASYLTALKPRVLLVGLNHDVHHEGESARLQEWVTSVRVLRPPPPPTGRQQPVAFCLSGSDAACGSDAVLRLEIDLARDGLSIPVSISHSVSSLDELRRDIALVRADARQLSSLDSTDYAALVKAAPTSSRAVFAGEAATSSGGGGSGGSSSGDDAFASAAPKPCAGVLYLREDYRGCLPETFTAYEGSPSAAFRGAWAWKRPPP